MLLAFSGTDGSGKSTQIVRVERALAEHGIEATHVWLRGGYTPGFQGMKSILRRLAPTALPPAGPSPERARGLQCRWLRRLWLTVAIIDMMVFCGIVMRFRLRHGRYLICDRYIDDTGLDFRRNFPHENVHQWWLWRLLMAVSPRPDFHFVLLVEPKESERRSRVKNEPFPDSRDTLEWRYKRYLDLSCERGYHVLDCSDTIEVVQKKIRATLQL